MTFNGGRERNGGLQADADDEVCNSIRIRSWINTMFVGQAFMEVVELMFCYKTTNAAFNQLAMVVSPFRKGEIRSRKHLRTKDWRHPVRKGVY